jgi:multidrug efflux system outer membrane protein
VFEALREVEDALVLGEASARNHEFTSARVAEARAADRLAKERYQRGVTPLITVLETERRLRLAEQAMITATSEVWGSRIDLFLALGGDWGTDRPPAPPAEGTEARSELEDLKSEIRNPKSGEVL